MSLIDIRCCEEACGVIREAYRPAAEWPMTPPCPECGGITVQVHLSSHERRLPDAVVVYQALDGSFRFPGDTVGSSVAKYEQMGYQRIEARGFAAVRALEKRLNQHELSQLKRAEERRLEYAEHVDADRRAEVRRGMAQGFQIPRETGRFFW